MPQKTQHKTRGPKSPFGAKSLPNRSYSLTDHAKKILAASARRTDESESNLVELLVRAHGGPALDGLVRSIQDDMTREAEAVA